MNDEQRKQCEHCGAFLSITPHDCAYLAFREALRGVELSEKDDRWLRWLAGWGMESREPFLALVAKIRSSRSTGSSQSTGA